MYAEAKAHALEPYAEAIDGSPDAAVCVVHAESLSGEARAALEAACAGIGFPEPSFLDARRLGLSGSGEPTGSRDASEQAGRDAAFDSAKRLFAVIEALDPLMLVVADAHAVELVAAAYREPASPETHGFVFGRPYAAFTSFRRDLADPRMKQRNWALLKAMRKSADWLG